jgi:colanic acid biosynthesis glycosyl transferase WcaI
MKMLIVGLNFFPEMIGVGKYTSEMAFWLSEHGEKVKVITGYPYYPQWAIPAEYKSWKYQTIHQNGIEIIRCPVWVPSKVTGLYRVLHLISFGLSIIPMLIKYYFWKPDVVIAIAPTLVIAPPVLLFSLLRGTLSWLHIQDFELEAAFNLEMLPGKKLVLPIARKLESYLIRKFDCTSSISESMISKIKLKGVLEDRQYLFPNWIDTSEIYPTPESNCFREQLGIHQEQIVILYSGNLGLKQGLDIIIDTARLVQGNEELVFVFCGEGLARPDLEKQAQGFENIKFLPLQPQQYLNELLNMADIHVLPQRANAADLVMPSKLSGMLASGKAVIATAEDDTEIGVVVSNVGVLVPPENPQSFAKAILELSGDKNRREYLGAIGREYAVEYWGKEIVLDKWLDTIKSCLEPTALT